MADSTGCSHSLDPLVGSVGPNRHSQGGQSQASHRQNTPGTWVFSSYCNLWPVNTNFWLLIWVLGGGWESINTHEQLSCPSLISASHGSQPSYSQPVPLPCWGSAWGSMVTVPPAALSFSTVLPLPLHAFVSSSVCPLRWGEVPTDPLAQRIPPLVWVTFPEVTLTLWCLWPLSAVIPAQRHQHCWPWAACSGWQHHGAGDGPVPGRAAPLPTGTRGCAEPSSAPHSLKG